MHELGLQVAGLMTANMIRRRLDGSGGARRILVPGLCGGEVEVLSEAFGVPVECGPKDLPEYFGTGGRQPDLSRHSVTIIAEFVDAPHLTSRQIVECAAVYRADGADVIDLGFLPGVSFPHLEEAVSALRREGHAVSVDSLEPEDLLRGGRAGADDLLSLRESTLHIADEIVGSPALIPELPSDLESLYRAAEALAARGRRFLLDPVLEAARAGSPTVDGGSDRRLPSNEKGKARSADQVRPPAVGGDVARHVVHLDDVHTLGAKVRSRWGMVSRSVATISRPQSRMSMSISRNSRTSIARDRYPCRSPRFEPSPR